MFWIAIFLYLCPRELRYLTIYTRPAKWSLPMTIYKVGTRQDGDGLDNFCAFSQEDTNLMFSKFGKICITKKPDHSFSVLLVVLCGKKLSGLAKIPNLHNTTPKPPIFHTFAFRFCKNSTSNLLQDRFSQPHSTHWQVWDFKQSQVKFWKRMRERCASSL